MVTFLNKFYNSVPENPFTLHSNVPYYLSITGAWYPLFFYIHQSSSEYIVNRKYVSLLSFCITHILFTVSMFTKVEDRITSPCQTHILHLIMLFHQLNQLLVFIFPRGKVSTNFQIQIIQKKILVSIIISSAIISYS